MKTFARATLLSIGLAALPLAQECAACPTCAGSAAKGADISPLVGLFMLVPWILAAAVTIVVRRQARPG